MSSADQVMHSAVSTVDCPGFGTTLSYSCDADTRQASNASTLFELADLSLIGEHISVKHKSASFICCWSELRAVLRVSATSTKCLRQALHDSRCLLSAVNIS